MPFYSSVYISSTSIYIHIVHAVRHLQLLYPLISHLHLSTSILYTLSVTSDCYIRWYLIYIYLHLYCTRCPSPPIVISVDIPSTSIYIYTIHAVRHLWLLYPLISHLHLSIAILYTLSVTSDCYIRWYPIYIYLHQYCTRCPSPLTSHLHLSTSILYTLSVTSDCYIRWYPIYIYLHLYCTRCPSPLTVISVVISPISIYIHIVHAVRHVWLYIRWYLIYLYLHPYCTRCPSPPTVISVAISSTSIYIHIVHAVRHLRLLYPLISHLHLSTSILYTLSVTSDCISVDIPSTSIYI